MVGDNILSLFYLTQKGHRRIMVWLVFDHIYLNIAVRSGVAMNIPCRSAPMGR
jgi:hypothetical protein